MQRHGGAEKRRSNNATCKAVVAFADFDKTTKLNLDISLPNTPEIPDSNKRRSPLSGSSVKRCTNIQQRRPPNNKHCMSYREAK